MARHIDLLRAVLEDLSSDGTILGPGLVQTVRTVFRGKEWRVVVWTYDALPRSFGLVLSDDAQLGINWGDDLPKFVAPDVGPEPLPAPHTEWMPELATRIRVNVARVRGLPTQLTGHEFDRMAEEGESIIPVAEPRRAIDRLLADEGGA